MDILGRQSADFLPIHHNVGHSGSLHEQPRSQVQAAGWTDAGYGAVIFLITRSFRNLYILIKNVFNFIVI